LKSRPIANYQPLVARLATITVTTTTTLVSGPTSIGSSVTDTARITGISPGFQCKVGGNGCNGQTTPKPTLLHDNDKKVGTPFAKTGAGAGLITVIVLLALLSIVASFYLLSARFRPRKALKTKEENEFNAETFAENSLKRATWLTIPPESNQEFISQEELQIRPPQRTAKRQDWSGKRLRFPVKPSISSIKTRLNVRDALRQFSKSANLSDNDSNSQDETNRSADFEPEGNGKIMIEGQSADLVDERAAAGYDSAYRGN